MGGKRMSGRSGSGEAMHPRISSGGSTKNSPIESKSSYYPKKESLLLNSELDDMSHDQSSLDIQRKNSFDIISLLENQDESISNNEGEKFLAKRSDKSSEVPSFWHFVEPDTKGHGAFQRPVHRHTDKEMMFASNNHRENMGNNSVVRNVKKSSADPKRAEKRRKMKKVQSAKVGGFKTLDKCGDRLRSKNREWLRVLTPPTGTSSFDSVNNDSEDELIRRYFSGLSSAGSSISWAEDAMESEFTAQLMKLWEDIEAVCGGSERPEKMSAAIYDECVSWRKAFPNTDLHRFSSFRNSDEMSLVASPTLLLEEETDADVVFSSLVQSSSPRSVSSERKGYEENMSLIQSSFRALNCSTPRPNIEKSTEYVNAWLSECQNSYVPEGNRPLLDHNNAESLSPLSNTMNGSSQNPNREAESGCHKGRHSLRLVSDVARSSYSHYSRSHAKFVNEPDPNNFFTSLAITNNETFSPLESKRSTTAVPTSPVSTIGTDVPSLPFGLPRFSNGYQSRINESDEEDDEDEGCSTPTEIVSFRPNVRVQRPISSRIRDHAITPIATSSYVQSSFGGRHHGVNVNKQSIASNSLANPQSIENYRGGRLRLFESLNTSAAPMSTAAGDVVASATNRIKSGFTRQGHSMVSQLGKSKQQPWSRHSGDDLTAEANYVTSLYENYPSSIGSRNSEDGVHNSTTNNVAGPNHCSSPTSAKSNLFLFHDRSRGIEGPQSLAECEDQSFTPAWLMNR